VLLLEERLKVWVQPIVEILLKYYIWWFSYNEKVAEVIDKASKNASYTSPRIKKKFYMFFKQKLRKKIVKKFVM
jgi:hypothetical protein